jgi:hypothetical protein
MEPNRIGRTQVRGENSSAMVRFVEIRDGRLADLGPIAEGVASTRNSVPVDSKAGANFLCNW